MLFIGITFQLRAVSSVTTFQRHFWQDSFVSPPQLGRNQIIFDKVMNMCREFPHSKKNLFDKQRATELEAI